MKFDTEEKQRKFISRTGGLLRVPGTGSIIVVNCQKTLPIEIFNERINQFVAMTGANFGGVTLESFTFRTPKAIKKKLNAQAAIFIIEDMSLPLTILSPEENWAFINIAPIIQSSKTMDVLKMRAQIGFVRAGALALGAWSARTEKSPLKVVQTPNDLDKLPVTTLTMNEFQGVMNYLPEIGIKPYTLTTYKRACREGWAPPPTNDIQKAIWEQVRTDKERGPTNPIKIPPPKKK